MLKKTAYQIPTASTHFLAPLFKNLVHCVCVIGHISFLEIIPPSPWSIFEKTTSSFIVPIIPQWAYVKVEKG